MDVHRSLCLLWEIIVGILLLSGSRSSPPLLCRVTTFITATREEIRNDITSKCFICGLDRATIDRKSTTGGFKAHYKIEHHMWTYLNFIVYLQEKDESQYTGQESYVSRTPSLFLELI